MKFYFLKDRIVCTVMNVTGWPYGIFRYLLQNIRYFLSSALSLQAMNV